MYIYICIYLYMCISMHVYIWHVYTFYYESQNVRAAKLKSAWCFLAISNIEFGGDS